MGLDRSFAFLVSRITYLGLTMDLLVLINSIPQFVEMSDFAPFVLRIFPP